MRIVVTGGTGYLGGAIVRAIHARGHLPIVFARRASASDLPGETIDGDIRDRASVKRAIAGADAVIHTAALVSLWRARRDEFDEINIGGLETVLDVCRSAGTSRVVYTSSFLALPPAGARRALEANDYQRTKVRGREIARNAVKAGLPLIAMYPGVIYGPGPATEGNLVARLVRDHLQGALPGIIGAERVWSYAYVDDVAEAHVTAIERGRVGEEYGLGGENVPQMRIFEHVRGARGTPLPRRIPFAIAALGAFVEERRARMTGRPPLLTRGTVNIFRHDWPVDSSRSLTELSYRVRPLGEGLGAVLKAL